MKKSMLAATARATIYERKVFVKKYLKEARGDLAPSKVGALFGVARQSIHQWEDPDGGAPVPRLLSVVCKWIEERTGKVAP